MKSEDFAMQELEKMRRKRAGEPLEGEGARPTTKFMIAADAPLVMTKACELLIKEVSIRAWRHTDGNRRKTLQKPDVHAAVQGDEMFDFLIDTVPRGPSDANSARENEAFDSFGQESSLPPGNNHPAVALHSTAHAGASLQQQYLPNHPALPPPDHNPDPVNIMIPESDLHNIQQQIFSLVGEPPTASGSAYETDADTSAHQQVLQHQQQNHDPAPLWGDESTEEVTENVQL